MNKVSLNFGALKESIMRLSSRDFLNESRNGVEDFEKVLNESNTLKKQYLVFKSIDTNKQFKKERLAERFLNQTLSVCSGLKWEDVLNENEKLRKEFLDNTYVGSTSNKDELFNSIHTMIESKCKGNNFNDLEKEQEAYEFIVDHLLAEKEEKEVIEFQDAPNSKEWEYVTKLALNNFNERYSHLSESEMEIVKVISSPSDKKINYLKDIIEENKELINKKLEEGKGDKDLLESFSQKLDKIQSDVVDQNTNDAIISCFSLNETLRDI